MAIVSLPSFGADPVSITGPGLDAKVDPLATDYNGNITNANISASAAIAYSKLNLATSIVYGDFSTSAFAAMTQVVNFKKGADIASATTTDIGAATGNSVDVTGTTTITGLGTVQAGTTRNVRFTGALTLTHNATTLILPTGANITTAAGDCALFQSLGSGNWVCMLYQRKDGTPLVSGYTASASNALSGSVLQSKFTQSSAVDSSTTAMPWDNTIPQNTEGEEFTQLATSITPNNSSNILEFDLWLWINHSSGAQNYIVAAIFQDSTANALFAGYQIQTTSYGQIGLRVTGKMTAGTTSSTTFKVRYGPATATGTCYTNADSSGTALFGGVFYSTFQIKEIKA